MARLFDFMYLVPSQLSRSNVLDSEEGDGRSLSGNATGESNELPAARPPLPPNPPGQPSSSAEVTKRGKGTGVGQMPSPPPPPPPLPLPAASVEHKQGAAKSQQLSRLGVPGNALSPAVSKGEASSAAPRAGRQLDQQSKLQELTAARLKQLRGTRRTATVKRRYEGRGDQEREIVHQLRSLYKKELSERENRK